MSQRSLGGEPGVAFPQLPRDSGRRGNAWERHAHGNSRNAYVHSICCVASAGGTPPASLTLTFPVGAHGLLPIYRNKQECVTPVYYTGVTAFRADFDLVFCPGILSRVCSLSGLSSASSSPDLLVAVRG